MGYKEEQEQHFGNRLAWCQAADHYLMRALKVPGCDAGGDFADTLGFVRDVVKARLVLLEIVGQIANLDWRTQKRRMLLFIMNVSPNLKISW